MGPVSSASAESSSSPFSVAANTVSNARALGWELMAPPWAG